MKIILEDYLFLISLFKIVLYNYFKIEVNSTFKVNQTYIYLLFNLFNY